MKTLMIYGSTKVNRKLLDSAARFYADVLFGERLARNISLWVHTSKNLLEKKGMYGSCMAIDEDIRRYPREFVIHVDTSVPRKMMLETLAHEMVHAKQYARGEMRELWSGKTSWKGQHIDGELMEYYDHPWEIEAHGRERGLFIRWINFEGIQNEKWTFDF